MTPVITLTETPDAKATTVIEEGLNRYNREQAGYFDGRGLKVLVSDPETHDVLGGILGRTSLGLCFLRSRLLAGASCAAWTSVHG